MKTSLLNVPGPCRPAGPESVLDRDRLDRADVGGFLTVGKSGEQDGRPADFVGLDETRANNGQEFAAARDAELAEQADRFGSGRPGAAEGGVVSGERMIEMLGEPGVDRGKKDVRRGLARERLRGQVEEFFVCSDSIPEKLVEGREVRDGFDVAPVAEEGDEALAFHPGQIVYNFTPC